MVKSWLKSSFARVGVFFGTRKNVICESDLENIDVDSCGTEIILRQLPPSLLNKLLHLLGHVLLTRIDLKNCFNDPRLLRSALGRLGGNRQIQHVELDFRENSIDDSGVKEITNLISRGVLKSLEVPEGLSESQCQDILTEIITKQNSQMRILNISGSILTATALKCLEIILQNRLVTGHLVLRRCRPGQYSSLTEKDIDMLKRAEKTSRRKYHKKVTIHMFNVSEREDIDMDDVDEAEVKITKLRETERRLSGSSGKETVAIFMVRQEVPKEACVKMEGRKRVRYRETSSKVRIRDSDTLPDELVNLFRSLDCRDDSRIQTPKVTEQQGDMLNQATATTDIANTVQSTVQLPAPEVIEKQIEATFADGRNNINIYGGTVSVTAGDGNSTRQKHGDYNKEKEQSQLDKKLANAANHHISESEGYETETPDIGCGSTGRNSYPPCHCTMQPETLSSKNTATITSPPYSTTQRPATGQNVNAPLHSGGASVVPGSHETTNQNHNNKQRRRRSQQNRRRRLRNQSNNSDSDGSYRTAR